MAPPYDHVVSPELALVDPELAARARAALPVRVVPPRVLPALPTPETAVASPSRLRGRAATPALTLVATAAASLIVTTFTGPDPASGELPVVEALPATGRAATTTGNAPARVGSVSVTTPPESAQRVDAKAPSSTVTRSRADAPAESSPSTAAPPPPTRATVPAPASAPRMPRSGTTLVWPRSTTGSSYDLELVRDGVVIYSTRLRSPGVAVPRSWQRDGVTYTIRPEDQAFVWSVVNGRRAAEPLLSGALALDLTLISRYVERSQRRLNP